MWQAVLLVAILAASLSWLWRGRLLKDRLWWSAWAVPAISGGLLIWMVAHDLMLQKALALLLMPAGLVWVGLIAAAVALARERRWGWLWAIAGLIALDTAAGNAWLGARLVAGLERDAPRTAPENLPQYVDAVLVLGGGSAHTDEGAPQLGSAGDRIAVAARLYFAGKAGVLIASGRSPDEDGQDYAHETAQLWRGMGIPQVAIRCLDQPRTTSEEIAACRELVAREKWHRIALVTSAWHLPRALANCRRQALEVVPLAADWRGVLPSSNGLWIIPQEKGYALVQMACWEYLGLVMRR